ncbi:uncharacterized protein C8A04DRAFT_36276 [Dichotomopilus funicola]|uniref:Uncharacterized protein n=1 Tax=Dichotomopilus funicola TaxID=1934379 RepID=A0AAN6ZNY9_9PEZI|nr:hypothetical protein C8A04DRAFT_36276 [Dichotomopilus funicola]
MSSSSAPINQQPILWTDEAWKGDPNGDLTLEFEGYSWKVREEVVTAHFSWMEAAIANTEPLWEDKPSFYSYARYYFLAYTFELGGLKRAMISNFEGLTDHVLALSKHRCWHCGPAAAEADGEEIQHLMSFLDAALFMEKQEWNAKMLKVIYDAGDKLKERLMGWGAFEDFVRDFAVGARFAKAIGADRS